VRAALILAFVGVVFAGCSGGDVTPGGDRCSGELATLGQQCPGSYEGTDVSLPMCPATDAIGFPAYDRTVWQCQDLVALQFAFALAGLVCYYDAVSHALVGAERYVDSPCDYPQQGIEAGRTNPMCRENAALFTRTCSEGGS
jgi:hypothetical protein